MGAKSDVYGGASRLYINSLIWLRLTCETLCKHSGALGIKDPLENFVEGCSALHA